MPIHLLRERATSQQIREMLADWEVMIKLVVDIRREVMAGGGEMHADSEALLLADGSQQADVGGADWYPDSGEVRYEALINIRPRDSNFKMEIQDERIRAQVDKVIRRLLTGDA